MNHGTDVIWYLLNKPQGQTLRLKNSKRDDQKEDKE
jgi:hypothetical protein